MPKQSRRNRDSARAVHVPAASALDKKWMAGAWDAFTIDEQYMIALTIAKDLNIFGQGLLEPATMPDHDKKRFVEMTMQSLTWNTYKHILGEGDEKQPLMQKISGPSHINIRDFTAILHFQERHPDLFTDTPAKDMFAQMNAFNRLFEGSYADEFKTILREI